MSLKVQLLVCLVGVALLASGATGRGLSIGGSTQIQAPLNDDDDGIVVVSPLRPCDELQTHTLEQHRGPYSLTQKLLSQAQSHSASNHPNKTAPSKACGTERRGARDFVVRVKLGYILPMALQNTDEPVEEVMYFRRDVDNRKLIREVKKRPALYNTKLKGHSDRNIREMLWDEVCRAVVSEWDNLTELERREHYRHLQRRWKSLKDCFRREQVQRKKGADSYRKRQYIYYNHLLFLANPSESQQSIKDDCANEADDFESKSEDMSLDTDTPRPAPPARPHKRSRAHVDHQTTRDEEEELLDIKLQELRDDDVDEDKLFLMSLIPGFRKLSDEIKFEAKIEMLKVMRNAHQQMTAKSPGQVSFNNTSTSNDEESKTTV
ncbi:hypothetical protein Pmani_022988 [Petrolisthes manimaculis]|uniref:BESS domain-containing protein n=1 Tax=Petrolisthes manimaculis TaxID=1843537 RepID=A0AAE1PCW6_9EUCA|nr:hypothetical protein Pmani_022988 [Petrolisthes manimaculis]